MRTFILLALLAGPGPVLGEGRDPDHPPVPARAECVDRAFDVAEPAGGKVISINATGSMLPTLDATDLVVWKPAPLLWVHPGDVVLFRYRTATIIHRAVHVTNDAIRTRGDALDHDDPVVTTRETLLGVALYAVNGQTCEVRALRVP